MNNSLNQSWIEAKFVGTLMPHIRSLRTKYHQEKRYQTIRVRFIGELLSC